MCAWSMCASWVEPALGFGSALSPGLDGGPSLWAAGPAVAAATGAGRGVGRHLTEHLAGHGLAVAGTARTSAERR